MFFSNVNTCNFIYKKDGKYKLRYEIKDSNKDVFGFFVMFKHTPQMLKIEDGNIRKMNTFEKRDILRDLTSFMTTGTYKNLIKTEKIWGYTTSQKSKKRENIIFKITDETKDTEISRVYPPGPGNDCIRGTIGLKDHDIMNMIIKGFGKEIENILVVKYDNKEDKIVSLKKDELNDNIIYTLSSGENIEENKLKFTDIYGKIYFNKKQICRLFEILCRYNRKSIGKNNYLSYDEIWLKYPPFNFNDKVEIV